MKKLIFPFIVLLMFAIPNTSFSQEVTDVKPVAMDTMVTKKNTFIIGKITKIGETEIEYKKVNSPDAPVYVVSKDKLKEIRFANGTKEKIVADEMDINKELEIIDRRSAIKFHFFSPVNDQLTFTYEHSLKVGTNLELTAGLINNSMVEKSLSSGSNLTQGGLFVAGVKFLLGQDYYIKGMKYTHPLKGRYFKPELAFSSFTIRSLTRANYNYNNYSYTPGPLIYSDRQITSVAAVLNYGRQFILGNVMTFGYSVGVGYSFVSSKYSNPNFVNPNASGGYYYGYDDRTPTNLYTHLRTGETPIAFTGTITLGYIFK
jgi:hypothetical protein